jgi:serine/threonine protein kinase
MEHLQPVSFVIRLYDHYDIDDFFVVAMERVAGVDMFDYLKKQIYIYEDEAKRLFAQVLQAVTECHQLGVVHRDIKDENILIDNKTQRIKLIDFGSAAFVKNNTSFNEFCGKMHLVHCVITHARRKLETTYTRVSNTIISL